MRECVPGHEARNGNGNGNENEYRQGQGVVEWRRKQLWMKLR